MNIHDRAMMILASNAQFRAATGGDALRLCLTHPIMGKRLQQWAMRWLARGGL